MIGYGLDGPEFEKTEVTHLPVLNTIHAGFK
jgi:hypothetical protein